MNRFVMAAALAACTGTAMATPDIICAVIEEAGKLAAEVLQPINKIGDEQGCTYDPETHAVTTPDGFIGAYREFAEAGWA